MKPMDHPNHHLPGLVLREVMVDSVMAARELDGMFSPVAVLKKAQWVQSSKQRRTAYISQPIDYPHRNVLAGVELLEVGLTPQL